MVVGDIGVGQKGRPQRNREVVTQKKRIQNIEYEFRVIMEILVFKTNLRFKKNINQVTPHLNELKGVLKWNIDFHDKDKILRIVSNDLSPRLVENTLKNAGYVCEELPD